MNITFRQLRAFVEVADCGSFTRAANKMHLTQSALSGLIKELEQTFGAKLFDRTTRQMHLSNVGERLLPQARRVLNELISLENEVDMLNNLAQGKVRLAVSQQFAATTMPTMMAKFKSLYPNIEVSLLDCSVELVLKHVEDGTVDLGIGAEREYASDVMADFLFELPFAVVMPKDHRLLQQAQVCWQDLYHERLISLQGPFNQRLSADLPEPLAKRITQPDVEVNFLSTALGMTRQGLGITLCLPFAADWVKQQDLAMRPLYAPAVYRRFFIYRRKSRALSPAALAFSEFLQANLAATMIGE